MVRLRSREWQQLAVSRLSAVGGLSRVSAVQSGTLELRLSRKPADLGLFFISPSGDWLVLDRFEIKNVLVIQHW
jgi:hypothetical protein